MNTQTAPTLSVITVTYNSGRFLQRCLASLERHLRTLRPQICVVDNASVDGTVDLVRSHFPGVHLIRNDRNLGFAAGLNAGLRATDGHYVLWLNPDTELLNDSWSALIEHLEANSAVGILGPKLVNPDGARQLSCRSFPSYRTALFHRYSLLTHWFPRNRYSREYLHPDWDDPTVRDVDWVSGACLLHRRRVADELGGLDERFFMYCEDVDFCLRARKRGWITRYHPAVRVMHQIGASTRLQHRRMTVERHRSMWRYYAKHFPRNPLKDAVVAAAIGTRYAASLLCGRIEHPPGE